jgi:acetyltransferase EpsM
LILIAVCNDIKTRKILKFCLDKILAFYIHKEMPKKLIIIGGAGKGGPIASCVEHNRSHYNDLEYEVYGFLNDVEKETINGYPVLGKISDYLNFLEDPEVYFIFAIHLVQNNFVADQIFHSLKIPTTRLATIIHKSSVIFQGAIIEPGVAIMAKCYLSKCHIKTGTVFLAGSNVGHDSTIGPLAFISFGCNIGSLTTIGRSAFLGMGSNILEQNDVEDFAIVAAGAVVNSIVPTKTIYGGVPAKYIRDVK